jgi:hypothetical protein
MMIKKRDGFVMNAQLNFKLANVHIWYAVVILLKVLNM